MNTNPFAAIHPDLWNALKPRNHPIFGMPPDDVIHTALKKIAEDYTLPAWKIVTDKDAMEYMASIPDYAIDELWPNVPPPPEGAILSPREASLQLLCHFMRMRIAVSIGDGAPEIYAQLAGLFYGQGNYNRGSLYEMKAHRAALVPSNKNKEDTFKMIRKRVSEGSKQKSINYLEHAARVCSSIYQTVERENRLPSRAEITKETRMHSSQITKTLEKLRLDSFFPRNQGGH